MAQIILKLGDAIGFHRFKLIGILLFQVFQLKGELIIRVNRWPAGQEKVNVTTFAFVFAVYGVDLWG